MRYLIISDIHANLAALDAVLSAAPEVDKIWCLGDIVGYGPDPHECIARLRPLPHVQVAGNHDWAAAGKLPLDEFNVDAREAVLWTRQQLTKDDLQYLSGLPERIVEGDFTLVHGSPRYPVWEYILSCSVARSNFDYFQTEFCLVGHSHVPIVYVLQPGQRREGCTSYSPEPDSEIHLNEAPRMIVNPGSVGQPRDGIPAAAYALLDTETGVLTFHRQQYDIEATQQRMNGTSLPRRLAARLSFGW